MRKTLLAVGWLIVVGFCISLTPTPSASSEVGPPYEATGEVVSLVGGEMEILDSTQTPKRLFRFILSKDVKISEEIKEGSMVHVKYTSKRLYGHRRERTAYSVELVNRKKR